MKRVVGDELTSRCKPVWGLDSEGEISGAWRNIGVPNMWYMIGRFSPYFLTLISEMMTILLSAGNLALCRFHSSHVALRKPILAAYPDFFPPPNPLCFLHRNQSHRGRRFRCQI